MPVFEVACQKEQAPSILVFGDDDAYRSLAEDLSAAGLVTACSSQWFETSLLLMSRRFDFVIISTMRAGDGLRFCHAIRRQSTIPLILLINSATKMDRIAGLEAGADDCLSQPLCTSELLARIRTIMRRSKAGSVIDIPEMRFAGWRINARDRLVYDPAGRKISLTAAEFDILLALCLSPGRAMTRAELLGLAHVGVGSPGERSIDVHIRRLRCKIEKSPRQPMLIKTIRLGGYIFTAAVEAECTT